MMVPIPLVILRSLMTWTSFLNLHSPEKTYPICLCLHLGTMRISVMSTSLNLLFCRSYCISLLDQMAYTHMSWNPVLTHCAPLTKLFRQSLAEGILPDEWKQAHVIPILKKGSRHKVTNYRPISLTSIVVKILESVMCTELLNILSENDILSHQQHDFICRKFCFTNLLVIGLGL